MILSWMFYVSAVTLLLALAARALEDAVRQRGLPIRGLWVLALIGSLLFPVLIALRPSPSAPVPTRTELRSARTFPLPGLETPVEGAGATDPPAGIAPARRLDTDPWLLALWALASLGTGLSLLASHRSLLRRRREWMPHALDGRAVWLSRDTGPAVVGFLPGRIVVPDWLLGAAERERTLALAHEEEHVRARDPQLLLGVLVASALLPWNLALWWIGIRLRRAIEIDCDLRVLARGADPCAYSRLLIEVTERGSSHRLAVAALSESSSFLEHRIRLMIRRPPPRGRRRAAGSLLLASSLALAAWQVERLAPPRLPSALRSSAGDADRWTAAQAEAMLVLGEGSRVRSAATPPSARPGPAAAAERLPVQDAGESDPVRRRPPPDASPEAFPAPQPELAVATDASRGTGGLRTPGFAVTLARTSVVGAGQLPGAETPRIAAAAATHEAPPRREVGRRTIQGVVIDAESRQPVPNAMVAAPQRGTGVIADAQGRFTLQDFGGEPQQVVFTQLGYDSLAMTLTVTESTGRIMVALTPNPVVLEGIRVTADRLRSRRTGLGGRVFERGDLLASTATNVLDFLEDRTNLRLATCVYRTRVDTCGWPRRGGPVSVQVFLDEAPLPGLDPLGRQHPSQLYMVEVYRGGSQIRLYTKRYMEDTARRGARLAWSLR